VTRRTRFLRTALVAALGTFVLLPVPGAFAGGGANGGGGKACSRNAPALSVDNNWAWATPGSWGLPGQQLTYAINVMNYDVGCTAASFIISMSAPSGFSVSIPTSTVSLRSSSSAYLWAYVNSPGTATDGDYPLRATVQRVGTSTPSATDTSYYKVYSTDTAAPTLFWPNPGAGQTISGNSYNIAVSSSDDHAVRKIELYIDNAYRSTTLCDDITYTCQLYYKWSLNGARGQHAVTFKSYDWLGNVGAMTVNVSVS
jgi:hypothetical protein